MRSLPNVISDPIFYGVFAENTGKTKVNRLNGLGAAGKTLFLSTPAAVGEVAA